MRNKSKIIIKSVLIRQTELWLVCIKFPLKCNQYYSTVVHLLIIYIAIFCHGTSLKKPSGHVGTRTCVADISSQQTCILFWGCMMVWGI